MLFRLDFTNYFREKFFVVKFGNVAAAYKVFRQAGKRPRSSRSEKLARNAVQEGIVPQVKHRQGGADARRDLSESLSIRLARTVKLPEPSMRLFGCAFGRLRVAARPHRWSTRQREARRPATGSSQEVGRDRRHLQRNFRQQSRELKPWRQHNAQQNTRHSLPFGENNSLIETPLITEAFPVLPSCAAIYSIKILFVRREQMKKEISIVCKVKRKTDKSVERRKATSNINQSCFCLFLLAASSVRSMKCA